MSETQEQPSAESKRPRTMFEVMNRTAESEVAKVKPWLRDRTGLKVNRVSPGSLGQVNGQPVLATYSDRGAQAHLTIDSELWKGFEYHARRSGLIPPYATVADLGKLYVYLLKEKGNTCEACKGEAVRAVSTSRDGQFTDGETSRDVCDACGGTGAGVGGDKSLQLAKFPTGGRSAGNSRAISKDFGTDGTRFDEWTKDQSDAVMRAVAEHEPDTESTFFVGRPVGSAVTMAGVPVLYDPALPREAIELEMRVGPPSVKALERVRVFPPVDDERGTVLPSPGDGTVVGDPGTLDLTDPDANRLELDEPATRVEPFEPDPEPLTVPPARVPRARKPRAPVPAKTADSDF